VGPAFRLYWRDYSGKSSQQTFWLPDGLTIAAYVARANALRNAAKALSNAVITGGDLIFDNLVAGLAGPPAAESDIRTNLILFFKGGAGDVASWRVPSPAALGYDTDGEWRGTRLQRAALDALGLLDDLEAAAALTVQPWGDPFPSTFSIGGLDFTVP